jgi:hypothetical protein
VGEFLAAHPKAAPGKPVAKKRRRRGY